MPTMPNHGAAFLWFLNPSHQSTRLVPSGAFEISPFLHYSSHFVSISAPNHELIQFADGTIWQEVSYQYLYLYEYYPTVIVCPSEGKIILNEHVFQIIQLR